MHTPSASQLRKAQVFRDRHHQGDGFIIPNPWDAGSARLLAQTGFEALATTSAGLAFAQGLPDGAVPRERVLAHLADIAAATDLPVNADLENGYGDAPEAAAEAIRLAAQAGAVGGSIEDTTGHADSPLYSIGAAAERVRAAVEAARALPIPFTLTARAENFFIGREDLADTIARLQAYQEAGADVLFAPGLRTAQDIATVVRSVDRPVNVLAGFGGMALSAQELFALGVRRISVGGGLARAAWGAVLRAAHEMRTQGSFGYLGEAAGGAALNAMFRPYVGGQP